MVRILVYSDVHIGDAWLDQSKEALSFICDVAKENEPDLILNLGDTFHAKGQASARCVSVFVDVLKQFPDILHYVLVGNHDYVDGHAVVECSELRDRVHCVAEPTTFTLDNGIPVALIPFTERKTIEVDDSVLVFSHTPITGALLTSSRTEAEVRFAKVEGKYIKLRISGHYHLPHNIIGGLDYPTIIVGSPDYYTWADVISFQEGKIVPRGCLLIDIDDNGVIKPVRVPNPNSTLRMVWQEDTAIAWKDNGEWEWLPLVSKMWASIRETINGGHGKSLVARWDYTTPSLRGALSEALNSAGVPVSKVILRHRPRRAQQESGTELAGANTVSLTVGDCRAALLRHISETYPNEKEALIQLLEGFINDSN